MDAATGGAVSGWARGNVSDTALGVAYHGVGIALALTGIGAVSRAIGGSGARAATRAAGRMAGGKVDDGLKGAAGVLDDFGRIDPTDIRFSQVSVGRMRNGNPRYLDEMISTVRLGGNTPPIRVGNLNGNLVSMDNRRLLAYRLAGRKVPVIIDNSDSFLAALQNRINNQKRYGSGAGKAWLEMYGNSGSPDIPWFVRIPVW